MPPTRQDRRPERTQGITVELTEFGLWIEVHDQPGAWEGVFLSARALRHLVALPAEARLAAEFAARLRDLVARGRAAGIIVCAATQKPSHEIIPTALRDLFGFRWAFRCLTPQASDTILGSGWASLGYAASSIDAADRGVGLLLAEGGLPTRLRACWLDDDQLHVLAARAEALRAGRPPDRPAAGPREDARPDHQQREEN